jgi:hypothetical protein
MSLQSILLHLLGSGRTRQPIPLVHYQRDIGHRTVYTTTQHQPEEVNPNHGSHVEQNFNAGWRGEALVSGYGVKVNFCLNFSTQTIAKELSRMRKDRNLLSCCALPTIPAKNRKKA